MLNGAGEGQKVQEVQKGAEEHRRAQELAGGCKQEGTA